MFTSERYGLCLRVQKHSVRDSEESFGPITVSKFEENMEFDGVQLQGVLAVQCLPDGSRFGEPLLFDFPVDVEATASSTTSMAAFNMR